MPKIVSPLTPIFSRIDGAYTWNPLTRPIPTAQLPSARFAVWLGGMGAIKVKPGWQFTDDLSAWSGSISSADMQTGTEWKTTADWTFGDASSTISDASGAWARFGVLAESTASSLPMQYASARIEVRTPNVNVGSLAVPPSRVWTKNTSDFIPLTPRIPAAQVSKVRAELELRGVDGTSLTVQPAWQEANEPPDDWSAATVFGSAQTAAGFYQAGAFATVSSTEQFVRLGVKVTQSSGSDVRSCIARLRFDWR